MFQTIPLELLKEPYLNDVYGGGYPNADVVREVG